MSAKKVSKRPQPTLKEVIEALQDDSRVTLSAEVPYGISDLGNAEITQIEPIWKVLPAARRRNVMRQLAELSETNFDMNFRSFGFMGLDDEDPGVRAAAVDVLWDDESLELMRRLISLTKTDDSREVRANAASALGRFILGGELDEVPQDHAVKAQEAVMRLLNDENEDNDVRRRALEAVSNSSHEMVPGAIDEAYHSDDQRMRVSSVFAMGRTYDDRWSEIVLKELSSSDPEMLYEAARAAGELEILESVPLLAQLLEENDREIKEVVIWSLGEIGGSESLRLLAILADEAEEAEDEDLLEAIDEAIGNASLVGDDMYLDD